MPPQSKHAAKRQSMMTWLWWNKLLDTRAFLVFQRLQRFYKTFTVLAALISGLAIGALTFDEFHPSHGLTKVSEGFLCTSSVTAVLAAVVATMLLFLFEGSERASRFNLAVAWTPLVVLDVSIVEFLIGMVCWYCEKNARWRGALVATQTCILAAVSILISVWMWLHMSQRGGLGTEETETESSKRRERSE